MFDNLVESSSHADDLARKGAFFGLTFLVEALIIAAAFVGGIILYDAQLENQNLELVTLVAPVPIEEKQPDQPKAQPKEAAKASDERQVATVREIVSDRSDVVSKEIKVTSTQSPPVAGAIKGPKDYIPTGGPVSLPGATGGGGTGGGGGQPVADEPPPPPPQPTPKPVPKAPISGGVLNGKAISLPKPPYPQIARAARASGTVTVQVTIDENGNVISASAVSGHPLLQQSAVQAARQAKFSPTKLSGQPVKVTGVITYNFVAQ